MTTMTTTTSFIIADDWIPAEMTTQQFSNAFCLHMCNPPSTLHFTSVQRFFGLLLRLMPSTRPVHVVWCISFELSVTICPKYRIFLHATVCFTISFRIDALFLCYV